MKKNIITISMIIFLAGCSSSPTKKDILDSESIILEEGGVNPVLVSDDQTELSKSNIFNENGFERVEVEKLTKNEKTNIIEDNKVFFDFDSNNLSEKSIKILKKHVDFMNKNPIIKVIIEGHTDKKGEKSYNLLLGERRAKAVKDFFVNNGINEKRIEVVSFGETKLLKKENTEEAHSKNRRSIIIY